ncbi:hypothetical protein PLESTB_001162700 [Pleodorina starrii]|uniref:Uncharacterized protein n=1 Tax=Pleodorina starrii TaxID=330485 RepID=A0A9W6BRT6_9CHLO|nr:hypothetical protein PLESTB_001162700 [Pleodorina starrii]GLC64750.1 hypothetical protein PLESTF_000203400 [Pleodorina starrii]
MFPELEEAFYAAEEAQATAQAQANMFQAGVSVIMRTYGPPQYAAAQSAAPAPRSRAPSPGRAPATATGAREAPAAVGVQPAAPGARPPRSGASKLLANPSEEAIRAVKARLATQLEQEDVARLGTDRDLVSALVKLRAPTVCVAGSLGAAGCPDGHGEGGKCKYGAEYGQGKALTWADLADRVARHVKSSKGQALV